jgi:phosphatidylserine decarboxylase
MIVFIVILIIILLLLFFYRHPTPIIRKSNEDYVYSPAFGRIMKISRQDDKLFISIFLSPIDVHYQYCPISGVVSDFKYDATGNFKLAYELNKSNDNEKAITTITNKHGNFIIYQIAGYIVRRISTFVKKSDLVDSGETIGLIHFGSRIDIIIPNAHEFDCKVSEGEYVSGFNTLLGEFKTFRNKENKENKV